MTDQLAFFPPAGKLKLDLKLEQWLTPSWVAEALLERHFSDLAPSDVVVDPGCGTGRWARAIRRLFPATRVVGVELDPVLAAVATAAGVEVVVGDYASVPLPVAPTVALGNWPFGAASFSRFLARSHTLLPEGARCGVLTSIYNFQTTSRVLRYAECWSLEVTVLPRDIFPRLQDALTFAIFRKDRLRRLWGLGLYLETSAARALRKPYRHLVDSQPSTWWAAVEAALRALGGRAPLASIYAETVKPTGNPWWREKIRQVLQQHARPLGDGWWALTC